MKTHPRFSLILLHYWHSWQSRSVWISYHRPFSYHLLLVTTYFHWELSKDFTHNIQWIFKHTGIQIYKRTLRGRLLYKHVPRLCGCTDRQSDRLTDIIESEKASRQKQNYFLFFFCKKKSQIISKTICCFKVLNRRKWRQGGEVRKKIRL